MDTRTNGLDHLAGATNDGKRTIELEAPYLVALTVEGVAPFLFHRWSVDAIAEKAAARKGSRAKKEDDIESYVYRDPVTNELAIPAEYFRQSLIHAAKYSQDPRSPRKSAMDLFKAGVVALTDLCPLGTAAWDYLDRRRVMVQRNGITRTRPAMHAGWTAQMELQVLLPEYIGPALLGEVLQRAGKLVGVGDFRPTYGRFMVTKFQVSLIG